MAVAAACILEFNTILYFLAWNVTFFPTSEEDTDKTTFQALGREMI